LAKEGYSFVLAALLLAIVFLLGIIYTGGIILTVCFVISFVLAAFFIYFFRDPERKTPVDKNSIISPADGKVIVIQEVDDQEFFKTTVKKVSIFMSVFSVHVNRMPITGKVTYFNYHRGKFHAAFKEAASIENEQTSIGVENDNFKMMFKQIAGVLARRIVCPVRVGWNAKQGERFGLIKFGSRVDLFFPVNTEVKVKLNDKVKAGETVIGSY